MPAAITRRQRGPSLIGLTLGAMLVLHPNPVQARSSIRDAFFSVYPAAVGTVIETVPSHPNHCGVCHFDFGGGGPRNPYGVRLQAVLSNYPNNPAGRQQAVQFIENEDPDGDGFVTVIEVTDTVTYVNTPTFPGLTSANVGNVSGVNASEILGHLSPVREDITPPDVTVISPNGGETYLGNTGGTVRWTATDPSGVVQVNIFLSHDNGQTFRPLAGFLSNTGSQDIFWPNRPGTATIIRVEAIDAANNVGHDDSDAPFVIEAPPGGIVPSTLRDFDLPGTQPLEGGFLSGPNACVICHGDYDPAVEPNYNWEGSMMAHASRDILFEACMTIANQDAPDSGDLCLRCHIPNGWLGGRSVPTNGSAMLASDMHGVSCDMCHRMVDPIFEPGNPIEDEAILAALALPPMEFGNGMFVIDPTGTRRGPFTNASIAHPTLVSPFHREAAFCGTCHNVSNPAFEKDAQGNYVPNAFDQPASSFSPHALMPLERTYSEWLNSAYNSPGGIYAPQFGGNLEYVSTCQDCHMRDVTGPGCNFTGAPIREDLPLHDLTGGSTWLPSLLPMLYPGQVNAQAIADGIARARYMLQNAAALDATQAGPALKVTVTNETGHKLPTGYPEGRRMWLNVRFYDAGQALIAESGAYDPATGTLAQDPEIKVYEAKLGVDEVVAPLLGITPQDTFHFALNNKIYKDNRIPPRGFTNTAFAEFGGAPVGATYEDGQYWDETSYQIPAGAASAEVTLYYQSTSKEYIEFLRDENFTNNKGQELYDLWNNNGKCPPEAMASASVTIHPGTPGDMNCDGFVDNEDIDPFVLALTAGQAAYQAAWPNCDFFNADINGDGFVDNEDIDPFVALITG